MPLAYLEHLVARLRKAGLLDSRRGSRGGYLLARPAEQITRAEVVEALEGSIAPIECISQSADGSIVCSRESDPSHVCPTKLLWTRVRFSIVQTLKDTTLADLLVPDRLLASAPGGVPDRVLAGTPASAPTSVSTTPLAPALQQLEPTPLPQSVPISPKSQPAAASAAQ
jgi:Rrf2 family protein